MQMEPVKKNITNTPGVEWVYYAFDNRLYYISDKDTCHRCYFLYEMDAAGNNQRKITNLQVEDSWMGSRNNGTEMIVAGRIGKQVRYQFFLVDIKTGLYRQLTNDTVSNQSDPLFLPGGKEIVLRYRPEKKLRTTQPAELWVMTLKVRVKDNSLLFQNQIRLLPGMSIMLARLNGITSINLSVIYLVKTDKLRYMQ